MSEPPPELPPEFERYSRQIRFSAIGLAGQRRLQQSQVLLIGCGALGSSIADLLVRAGVGQLRLVDRDFLEWNNLQRQSLYDEADVAEGLPKAIVAARRLRQINSTVTIEPHVLDFQPTDVDRLIKGVHLILDGTDNFETRFLINDAAIRYDIPWVFGGCLGADGQAMAILPGQTPCLRCLMPEGPPDPGTSPTCDSFGVLGPAVQVIAALQATAALKILSGHPEAILPQLSIVSLWSGALKTIDVGGLRDAVDCPACRHHRLEWLEGQRGTSGAVLCGRNAVQIRPDTARSLDLAAMEIQLQSIGAVDRNPFLLRLRVDSYLLTLFPDGRAIVGGTEDPAVARNLYSRYFGN